MKYKMISEEDVKAIRVVKNVLRKLQREGRRLNKLSDENPKNDEIADAYDRLLEEIQSLGVFVDEDWGMSIECCSD